MSYGPNPWQQLHWDGRAAANFMAGGSGCGLIVAAALGGSGAWVFALGAALVAIGLTAVWLEIGRPLRAINVLFHPQRSWMTREAIVAAALMASVAAVLLGMGLARWAAALCALAFIGCQGLILRAAKGIPAWREPRIVPLIVSTALAEGLGLWLLLGARAPGAAWLALALLLVLRLAAWTAWRGRLRTAPRALAAVDQAGMLFRALSWAALVLALVGAASRVGGGAALVLQAATGALALAGGAWFKYTLITRAAFNQGFALPHLPVRGASRR